MCVEEMLNNIHKQIISASSEYVNHLAEYIYIYYVSERHLLSFDVFYKINNIYVERGEINRALSNNEYVNESSDKQCLLLDDCLSKIEEIRKYYVNLGEKPHTECFLVYDVLNDKLIVTYNYNARYETRPDDVHMTPEEEFDKWFSKVKSQGL
ncbi:hypothetical protein [Streptococcus cuniculipharyngis]|uniref:DUF600 domain-containing protein n=1 Tax=Streptococcus cuniculipharyngis TaxID=1562651 RepID=A0A5C5SF32_9STRE|nr:hypothetical protein [Streptococcus cuniculipharyngis]TWS98718.1 hypothetical protein FRX57_00380 [Streptococcus cuniculipharyngis]